MQKFAAPHQQCNDAALPTIFSSCIGFPQTLFASGIGSAHGVDDGCPLVTLSLHWMASSRRFCLAGIEQSQSMRQGAGISPAELAGVVSAPVYPCS
jgi:hypothetical protein